MNPISFSDCINSNKEILGTHCENLGKNVGSGFLGASKVFFSYDTSTGWSVVQLNVLQLFLRNVLGFYKSTQTETILKQWKVLKNDECEALNIPKIQDFWKKRYFIKFGNTGPGGEFQVRCYGEYHGKKFYRKRVCEDIDKNYRRGDVILLEGLETGKKISKKDTQITFYLKGSEYHIEGWEPENFEELKPKFIVELERKEKDLKRLLEDTIKAIDEYSISKNEKELIAQTSNFASQYNQLANENKLPSGFIQKLVNECSGADNPVLVMKCVITQLIIKLTTHEKNIHRGATVEDLKKIMDGLAPRNKSLHDQIEKYASEGRRVFVIGGQSHFLFKGDGFSSKEFLKPVYDALSKHKFEIFCKRARVVKDGSSPLVGFHELR